MAPLTSLQGSAKQELDSAMKLYWAILFFLISGVAQADSLAVTALFEDPVKILLTLFEGAVALTAFSGIAVVIGRRSGGQWTQIDAIRFGGLVINGVMAAFLCLLPFLIISPTAALTEDSWNVVLFWAGGVGLLEVQWRARVAWVLIKKQLDEDSGRWLPIVTILTDVIAYALVFLVAFDLVEIHEFRMLVFLIVWHLFSAVYLFLRLIRHSGVKISSADN